MTRKFVLDLNDRERRRYSVGLTAVSDTALRAKAALETHDDAAFIASVLVLGMSWSGLGNEMLEVIKAGQAVDIPDDAEGAERP